MAGIPGASCRMDPLGGGSEEDACLSLKYYHDVSCRAWWYLNFKDEIPAHEDPPCDRDKDLPRPPWG